MFKGLTASLLSISWLLFIISLYIVRDIQNKNMPNDIRKRKQLISAIVYYTSIVLFILFILTCALWIIKEGTF